MSETKRISVAKQAFKDYKQSFAFRSGAISFLGLVIILCLMLAFVFPLSLLLTIPFLILPMILGFIGINLSLAKNNPKPTLIFRIASLYYTSLFYGCFRYMKGLLKAIIAYLITSFVAITILYFTVAQYDAEFMNLMTQTISLENSINLTKLIEDLQGNSTYVLIENITAISAFFLFSYVLIHHILKESLKASYNIHTIQPMPSNLLNIVHKRAFKGIRKDFYLNYYASQWFVILLFVLGYWGGSLLAVFVFNLIGFQAAIFGLFVAILLTLFLLPYTFGVINLLSRKYSVNYVQSFIRVTQDQMNDIKTKDETEMKQVEDIKKFLDELQKSLEDKSDDNKKDQ